MLEINSIAEYNVRLAEINNSTDTLTGMAQKWADFYGAVAANRTYNEAGTLYLFHLGSDEYMRARWMFQHMLAVAYPQVKADRLYTEWLMCDGTILLAQLAEDVLRASGAEYRPWAVNYSTANWMD